MAQRNDLSRGPYERLCHGRRSELRCESILVICTLESCSIVLFNKSNSLSWPSRSYNWAATNATLIACSSDYRTASTECLLSANCLAVSQNSTTNQWCWVANWGNGYAVNATSTIIALHAEIIGFPLPISPAQVTEPVIKEDQTSDAGTLSLALDSQKDTDLQS